MRVYYAEYARPYNYNAYTAKTHWGKNYCQYLITAFSAYKSKEFFGHTVLTCDEYSKSLIVDTLGIKFDEVRVELDGCEDRGMFWAAGKIYGYTKAIKKFEPFMFLDNDAGFRQKPSPHYFDSRYRCQHIHRDKGNIFDKYVRRLVRETKNEYPYDIFHDIMRYPEGVAGGNAGIVIFGHPDSERLWAEFSRYTWDMMNSDFMKKVANESMTKNLYQHMSYWNVIVEEILLLQLCRRLFGEVPQTFFEFTGLTPTPGSDKVNPADYFHIWGRKSDLNTLNRYEREAVDYLPKELTDGIYEHFKVKR